VLLDLRQRGGDLLERLSDLEGVGVVHALDAFTVSPPALG
jgi:hypothetical protein